jgi:hypothetical protein
MARPESIAVAGYFPAPPPVIAALGALLRPTPPVLDDDGDPEDRALAIVDPCAADGKAVAALAAGLTEGRADLRVEQFVCELEATRYYALLGALRSKAHHIHGDAFCLRWARAGDRRGASVLLLNPPYDQGKLEARWLARFTDCLAQGGVLALLVPVSALPAVAPTLAQHFGEIACYRFPPDLFAAFRQVVVLARRTRALLAPDPPLAARIAAWADAPDALAVLPEAGSAAMEVPVFEVGEEGFSKWELAPVDFPALLAQARPWHRSDRRGALVPVPGLLPEGGAAVLGMRTFPAAMPLGDGHVPPALACGVFNGVRLAPDDASLGLPDIYAKAVFRKRWSTAEQRRDKHGNVVGELQVQQPELVMTALDLARGTYHRPRSAVSRTDARRLADMTAADLLASYRGGFRAVLRDRCPALFDPGNPAHHFALPELPRRLFTAQADVTRAIVRLLQTEGAALLLGQVGVGKSTIACAGAQAIAARRVVVVCPPHLLDNWTEQAGAVVPWARTMILADVGDVDAFATAPDEGMVLGILAQTAGKLGHAWAGIRGPCPRCGEIPRDPPAVLAEKRLRCGRRPLQLGGPLGAVARDLALALLPVFADEPALRELLPARGPARLGSRWAAQLSADRELSARRWASPGVRPRLVAIARALARRAGNPMAHDIDRGDAPAVQKALVALAAALADDALTCELAREVYTQAIAADPGPWDRGADARICARRLLLLLPPGGEAQTAMATELRALGVNDDHYGTSAWEGWEARVRKLQGGWSIEHWHAHHYHGIELKDGSLRVGRHALGEPRLAFETLGELREAVSFRYGPPCPEPLYQAIPDPRRTPLAAYLAKHHKGVVDLAIIDEAHECTNQDSAQAQAMAQFMGTRMLLMTGSLSNGYATGMFAILWTISRKFREQFGREQLHDFGRTFGYLRRYVEEVDRSSGEVVAYGKNSDCIQRRQPKGYAPGILPSLILTHVLPLATVLRMKDLEVELPPRREVVEVIDPGPELGRRVRALRAALMARIRKDRGTDLAGKLFGQMGEEWSAADRASLGVGNSPDGVYRIRYPEKVGGEVVATLEPMPADEVLPKERRLLEIVKAELAEDRPVLVFAWHSHCGLFQRLARLIERETGEAPVVLDAEKVPAKKRDAWLKREVVAKGKRVLICNPAAVETGLNSLTRFCTLVWFQPPDCDPRAKRQAEGRVYRIGQARPVRVHWLLYRGTSQEVLHRLLLLKVAESEAVDGLDPTSALTASGIGAPPGMTGFDLGRAIFEVVEREGEASASPPAPTPATASRSPKTEVSPPAPPSPQPTAFAAKSVPAPNPATAPRSPKTEVSPPAPLTPTGRAPEAQPPPVTALAPERTAPMPPVDPIPPAPTSGVVERRVGRTRRASQLGWAW